MIGALISGKVMDTPIQRTSKERERLHSGKG